jgi:hypothetical protein
MKRTRNNHSSKLVTLADTLSFPPLEAKADKDILLMLGLKPRAKGSKNAIESLNSVLIGYFHMLSIKIDEGSDTVTVQRESLKKLERSTEKLSGNLRSMNSDLLGLIGQEYTAKFGWSYRELHKFPVRDLSKELADLTHVIKSLLEGELSSQKGQEPDKYHLFPVIKKCEEIWNAAHGPNASNSSNGVATELGRRSFTDFVFCVAKKINKDLSNVEVCKSKNALKSSQSSN